MEIGVGRVTMVGFDKAETCMRRGDRVSRPPKNHKKYRVP